MRRLRHSVQQQATFGFTYLLLLVEYPGEPKVNLSKYMAVSENEGYLICGGAYNKDPTIQSTILGSLFSETPIL